jgi:hypothetical protein
MQITTNTGRTVEIYMNNESGVTYRNTKNGAAFGPLRSADRATAKAGSVGREILDTIDAQAAAEVEVEAPAAEVAPVETVEAPAAEVAPVETVEAAAQVETFAPYTEAEIAEALAGMSAKALARKGWSRGTARSISNTLAGKRIRRAVNLKW